MRNLFVSSDEAADIIRGGDVALFAGSEAALASLPRGQWIGGTTVYFMTDHGGTVDSERLFCTVIDEAVEAHSSHFAPDFLNGLTEGQYRHGFTYVLVPAFSPAHDRYALDAPCFPKIYAQPVMGWVTGVPVSEIGTRAPKVFDGPTGQVFEDAVLALYVRLPDGIKARLDTINLFAQGAGPAVVFPETGFSARDCLVDGVPTRIGQYLATCDTRLPLVADYAGVMINVSVQSVNTASGEARFYAPVVAGETYRVAQPIPNYGSAYVDRAKVAGPPERTLSCNCVLNFLYAELEGKSTGGYVGPVTFGEIAYILVNQTLVRLSLMPVAQPAAGAALV